MPLNHRSKSRPYCRTLGRPYPLKDPGSKTKAEPLQDDTGGPCSAEALASRGRATGRRGQACTSASDCGADRAIRRLSTTAPMSSSWFCESQLVYWDACEQHRKTDNCFEKEGLQRRNIEKACPCTRAMRLKDMRSRGPDATFSTKKLSRRRNQRRHTSQTNARIHAGMCG